MIHPHAGGGPCFPYGIDFWTMQKARVKETRWLPQLRDQEARCKVGDLAHNSESRNRATVQLTEERGHNNDEWLLREEKVARKLARARL